jgi:hypothetical protein
MTAKHISASVVFTLVLIGPALSAENIQLFLKTGVMVPVKGYVEDRQPDPQDQGKVAFKECRATDTEWVDPKSLQPTSGTCGDVWQAWAGTIVEETAASITIMTADYGTIAIDTAKWQEAFGENELKWPNIGDAIGGYDVKNPQSLFQIESGFKPQS